MNKIYIPVIALALSVSVFPLVDATESLLPDWFKTTANLWSTDQVSDQEFIDSIQFLAEQGLIDIASAQASGLTEQERAEIFHAIEVVSSELYDYQASNDYQLYLMQDQINNNREQFEAFVANQTSSNVVQVTGGDADVWNYLEMMQREIEMIPNANDASTARYDELGDWIGGHEQQIIKLEGEVADLKILVQCMQSGECNQ